MCSMSSCTVFFICYLIVTEIEKGFHIFWSTPQMGSDFWDRIRWFPFYGYFMDGRLRHRAVPYGRAVTFCTMLTVGSSPMPAASSTIPHILKFILISSHLLLVSQVVYFRRVFFIKLERVSGNVTTVCSNHNLTCNLENDARSGLQNFRN